MLLHENENFYKSASEEVLDFSGTSFIKISKDMYSIMQKYNTRYITSRHAGYNLNIIYINAKLTGNKRSLFMINSFIKDTNNTMIDSIESDIIIPGKVIQVPRYQFIKVSYVDKNNKRMSIELSGFYSCIYQKCEDILQGRFLDDRYREIYEGNYLMEQWSD